MLQMELSPVTAWKVLIDRLIAVWLWTAQLHEWIPSGLHNTGLDQELSLVTWTRQLVDTMTARWGRGAIQGNRAFSILCLLRIWAAFSLPGLRGRTEAMRVLSGCSPAA